MLLASRGILILYVLFVLDIKLLKLRMVSAWNNKSLTSMQNLVQISNENGFNVFVSKKNHTIILSYNLIFVLRVKKI